MQHISKGFLCVALACAPLALTGSAQSAMPTKAAAVKAGQEIFTSKCFQCHSVQPDQMRLGPSLYNETKKPHAKKTDAQVREIVKEGKNKMPAFGDKLTKEETDDLLAYIHTL